MSYDPERKPPDNVADLTLTQLKGLRREVQAVMEQQVRLFEHFNRLQVQLLGFREEVRDAYEAVQVGLGSIRKDIGAIREDVSLVKSDVILLEGHNASRHGEILNLMRKTEGLPEA
jgi:hypothetical protein